MSDRPASTIDILKVLANENRFRILGWLLDPVAHFPPQRDGDLVDDGVCLGAIVRKLGVSQPTATGYMQALADVGLVSSTRIGNWVFFRARPDAIAIIIAGLEADLGPSVAVGPRARGMTRISRD